MIAGAGDHGGWGFLRYSRGVTEQPHNPRRQPGEPHPYMLQRNPPNLWILVALTVFSLALTVVILALTVVL